MGRIGMVGRSFAGHDRIGADRSATAPDPVIDPA
jgi:hypothetical protein